MSRRPLCQPIGPELSNFHKTLLKFDRSVLDQPPDRLALPEDCSICFEPIFQDEKLWRNGNAHRSGGAYALVVGEECEGIDSVRLRMPF
jgi:hypothetical protein